MKRILFFLLFTGIAFSCQKEYYTSIPDYPVNLELSLNGSDYNLNANLAYKVFTQPRLEKDRLGFGGILVINRLSTDGNPVNLNAYDLACPVEVQRNVRVVPDKTGVTAICPKCGAVFWIADGTGAPKSGTKYYLKSYRIVDNGNGIYTVIN